jgi:hypothetical protein
METDALSFEDNFPSHPEKHHKYQQCQVCDTNILILKEKVLTNQCSIPLNFQIRVKLFLGRANLINPRKNFS